MSKKVQTKDSPKLLPAIFCQGYFVCASSKQRLFFVMQKNSWHLVQKNFVFILQPWSLQRATFAVSANLGRWCVEPVLVACFDGGANSASLSLSSLSTFWPCSMSVSAISRRNSRNFGISFVLYCCVRRSSVYCLHELARAMSKRWNMLRMVHLFTRALMR